MLTVEHARDLALHAGTALGQSGWKTIDAEMVEDFARTTGDDNWIHLDPARAARELPGGRTIAHGLLLLSLIPVLQREIYTIRRRGRGLNYGYDRVRFIAPVPTGAEIRLRLVLVEAEPHALGTALTTDATIVHRGSDKPALVARNILLITDD